jgi:hypothetical protein
MKGVKGERACVFLKWCKMVFIPVSEFRGSAGAHICFEGAI